MTAPAPSFVLPIALSDVPSGGRIVRIATTAEERAEVAATLHLPGVEALEARLDVRPFGKDGLAVTGEIHARVTQTCVVTLEAFDSDVVAPVEIRFSPEGRDPNAEFDLAELTDLNAEDPPDLLIGGRIDLAAIVIEFLALALDPYPRKPGVAFADATDAGPGLPFSTLAGLKKPD